MGLPIATEKLTENPSRVRQGLALLDVVRVTTDFIVVKLLIFGADMSIVWVLGVSCLYSHTAKSMAIV